MKVILTILALLCVCFAVTQSAESQDTAVKANAKPAAEHSSPAYDSPIHFRPHGWALADTMPIFWKGEYHVFYLSAPMGHSRWEHIVSTDLVQWKELPTALIPDGAPDGPDGGNMFTGSVIEKDGTIYLFYQGQNSKNPNGTENIKLATSRDMVHCTKVADFLLTPDGIHYDKGIRNDKNILKRDFRDPYVFWNDEDQYYWMLITARRADNREPVAGVAKSKDLIAWEQYEPLLFDPPLRRGVPECPDLFKIGETYYILFSPYPGKDTTFYRYSKKLRGPYLKSDSPAIDTSILYAAKRMWDGRRHVLTGWIRDMIGNRDDGVGLWGGTQSLPREVYAGPNGLLYFKPVDEVVAAFTKLLYDMKWIGQITVQPEAPAVLEAPPHYMLDCRVRLEPQTEFTVAMRQQEDLSKAYRLTVRPAKSEAEISGPGFSSKRTCYVDPSKPVKIQAFVQGTIIECFINDQYAFSWRAYDLSNGKLDLSTKGGNSQVESLQLRLTPSKGEASTAITDKTTKEASGFPRRNIKK
ncbi:MAG: GH32 C-terminal domain-containing protein [Planctomycetota bacterium]